MPAVQWQPMTETRGERLRRARLEQPQRGRRRLLQQEAAGELGVSQAVYSQWETDAVALTLERIEQLARFYGVRKAWLACWDDGPMWEEESEEASPESRLRPATTEAPQSPQSAPVRRAANAGSRPTKPLPPRRHR